MCYVFYFFFLFLFFNEKTFLQYYNFSFYFLIIKKFHINIQKLYTCIYCDVSLELIRFAFRPWDPSLRILEHITAQRQLLAIQHVFEYMADVCNLESNLECILCILHFCCRHPASSQCVQGRRKRRNARPGEGEEEKAGIYDTSICFISVITYNRYIYSTITRSQKVHVECR